MNIRNNACEPKSRFKQTKKQWFYTKYDYCWWWLAFVIYDNTYDIWHSRKTLRNQRTISHYRSKFTNGRHTLNSEKKFVFNLFRNMKTEQCCIFLSVKKIQQETNFPLSNIAISTSNVTHSLSDWLWPVKCEFVETDRHQLTDSDIVTHLLFVSFRPSNKRFLRPEVLHVYARRSHGRRLGGD